MRIDFRPLFYAGVVVGSLGLMAVSWFVLWPWFIDYMGGGC